MVPLDFWNFFADTSKALSNTVIATLLTEIKYEIAIFDSAWNSGQTNTIPHQKMQTHPE